MIIAPDVVQAVLVLAAILGMIGAAWSAFGARSLYDDVGRGYMDVGDSDPFEQSEDEPLELLEVRQLVRATEAMRQRRGE